MRQTRLRCTPSARVTYPTAPISLSFHDRVANSSPDLVTRARIRRAREWMPCPRCPTLKSGCPRAPDGHSEGSRAPRVTTVAMNATEGPLRSSEFPHFLSVWALATTGGLELAIPWVYESPSALDCGLSPRESDISHLHAELPLAGVGGGGCPPPPCPAASDAAQTFCERWPRDGSRQSQERALEPSAVLCAPCAGSPLRRGGASSGRSLSTPAP